jgi:VWFA-related protein
MIKIKFLLILILSAALPLNAGPFLKIASVDGKSDYPRVAVTLTISGPGTTSIGGLDEENILIYEDGYRAGHVRVLNFSETADYLYLVFSIDSSKSIKDNFMKGIKASASDIISAAGEKDQIAVYRFNGEGVLLNNFTSKKDELLRNISTIQNRGSRTLLYNTIFDALELLNQVKGERKALIVFTDGKDEGSSVTDNDVIDFSRKYGVPVFFITMNSVKDLNKIARVAKLTGGKVAFSDKTEDLSEMYRSVLSAVKSRYVVKYVTMFKPDGKTRQIEARLSYGNVRDRDTHDVVFESRDFLSFMPDRNTMLVAFVIVLILLLFVLLAVVAIGLKGRINNRNNDCDVSVPILRRDQQYYPDIQNAVDDEYDDDAADPGNENDHPAGDGYRNAWLLIKGQGSSSGRYDISEEETIIGSGEGCGVKLDDSNVSEKHFKIKNLKGNYYVFDLISARGTYLNGKKLLRPKPLYDWDEIKTGSTLIVFRGRS